MDCNPRACPNAPSLTSQRRGGSHAGSTQSVSQGARRPHVRAGSEGIFAAERSGLLGGLRDEEAGFALLVDVGHDLLTALVLFEYEQQSMGEIATALGCTAKAVENRLYRARQKRQQQLA